MKRLSEICLWVVGQSLISSGDMIFSVTDVLLALSELYILRPGDLVFMGTPSGVAALQKGDRFHAVLQGVTELQGTII